MATRLRLRRVTKTRIRRGQSTSGFSQARTVGLHPPAYGLVLCVNAHPSDSLADSVVSVPQKITAGKRKVFCLGCLDAGYPVVFFLEDICKKHW